MKVPIKSKILCILLITFISILTVFSFIKEKKYTKATQIYQVYLDGNKIGLIKSKDELYSLINKEQSEIKDEYNVDQVYPPKGFQIVKKNTYDKEVTTVKKVYDSIKDEKKFTVKGYTITIKPDVENATPTYIYVLEQNVFEEALNNVVATFIGEERYEQYLTDTQAEIIDTGYIIENMYFKDNITIKESYISTDETIYTDANELTKYLLFGENESQIEYTVTQGDTVSSIAEKNKLNVEELLIANDDIKSSDTLLAIGQKINVALIDPVLSLVYEELITSDVEQQYQSVVENDSSKYTNYSKVKQEGINGINRITSRVQFVNGEQSSGGTIIGVPIVIRPVQNKITIKGTKKRPSSNGWQSSTQYVDTGAAWAWPTNSPYIITSEYGYRWGTLHDGMDISGTGYGSPVYASLDGVVVQAQYSGIVGRDAGLNVVIDHQNGWFTVYAHCSKVYVKAGQRVSRKQRIAAMGNTGNVTGTHLHFGLFRGKPYSPGSRSYNPRTLWR